MQDNEDYPLLNAKAEELCDLLESIIIRSFGSGCYYTDHENGSYKIIYKGEENRQEMIKEDVGLYLDGRCFGLTITTNFFKVLTVDGNVRDDIKWNQCSLFGQYNNWQKVIDLCDAKK